MAKDKETVVSSPNFPIAYTVINVEPWTFLDARNNPVNGYKVTYTYGEGYTDWVDVPEKVYNAATVKRMIEERITKHAEVFTLGS
jgi:hypothetical protein